MGKNVPSFFWSVASEGKMNAMSTPRSGNHQSIHCGIGFRSDSSEKPRMMSMARNGVVSTAAMKRKRMWSRAAYQAKKMNAIRRFSTCGP